MATILIGGDLCPIGCNAPLFLRGDAAGLFGDLLPEMAMADLVVGNLECAVVERPSPIPKTGPHFGVRRECLGTMQAAGIDLLCLANNHILDHGEAGLQFTLDACRGAGIATVGAGRNLEEAGQFWMGRLDGLCVGIAAMAEHEFSIAGAERWGANPLDLVRFTRTLAAMADRLDYLLVLVHGSQEFFVPTPRTQEICRFLIELGANAVVVQHPHVLGGWETYQGGHIVYGNGAWIMDEAVYRGRRGFHEGFLVKLELSAGQSVAPGTDAATSPSWMGPRGRSPLAARMEAIPFVQSKPAPGAHRLVGAEAQAWQERMTRLSAQVADAAWVRAQWRSWCEARRHDVLSDVLGHKRLLRWLNRRGALERWWHGRRALLGSRNMVLCESHREILETLWMPGSGGS